jgi:CheY-like chemotaxis protein
LARKILLADDSVTAQNMGRKILTDAGYEVITVNNGSAALKKITETRPDLIVLDVYMPGYSGLEVCQRAKENRDTGHIPVLLTVGKLEPFKQDEARRVRADAFIIKPFEASELLAALGKLEDKVAPRARSKESHLPITTMASFERLVEESGPQYGDQESGWKERLTIPRGPLSAPEPEPEQPAPPADFRDIASEQAEEDTPAAPSPVAVSFERPIPAGIPQDITPEEIAAISAAAARVSMGLSVSQEIERTSARTQTSAEQTSPTVETKAWPVSEGATQAAVPAEPAAEPRPEAPLALDTAAELPSLQESQSQPAFEPAFAEKSADETAWANGNQASSHMPEAVGRNANDPVTVAAAPVPETVQAAARWIAEKVPVEAHEAVLVLEREMHKAHAAFAAFEHGASPEYESAPVDRNDEPEFATMAPPAIGTPMPGMSADVDQPAEEPSQKESALAAAASVGFQDIQRPAEAAKPPASPFAPPTAVDESRHAVAAFGGPHPFGGPELEAAPISISSGSEPSDQAIAPSPESVDQHVETAAASADAFASWKDIREIASKPAPQPEPAAAAYSESTEASLSSIVDTMLAELKPKLMAELAKKLEKRTE